MLPLRRVAYGEAEHRPHYLLELDGAVAYPFRHENERALSYIVQLVTDFNRHVPVDGPRVFLVRPADQSYHLVEIMGMGFRRHGHVAAPYPDEIYVKSPRRYLAVQRHHMRCFCLRGRRHRLTRVRRRPVALRLGD